VDSLVEELFAALDGLGELRARRMFGGTGLYCDDVFFGLVAEGVLYFKVDAESVEDYRAAGAAPFRPFPERPAAELGYFAVPLEVQERRERLHAWAARALVAARGRDAAKRRKPRTRAGESGGRSRPRSIGALPGIGPRSAARLRAVGIADAAALERVGAVAAFRALVAAGHAPPVKLLYALEGARLGLRVEQLSAAMRANLRARAGLE
jgi:DNA transformation protein